MLSQKSLTKNLGTHEERYSKGFRRDEKIKSRKLYRLSFSNRVSYLPIKFKT